MNKQKEYAFMKVREVLNIESDSKKILVISRRYENQWSHEYNPKHGEKKDQAFRKYVKSIPSTVLESEVLDCRKASNYLEVIC